MVLRRFTQLLVAAVCAACCFLVGCGTTRNRVATEQLLVSDAVDRAVENIDFSGLAGQKVFLDTRAIQHIKAAAAANTVAIINADYITSAIRQQMITSNVVLEDKLEDADYVVELRCGAIGSDVHEVVYGIPANNALNSVSSLMPNTPPVPTIPEIALAKRNDQYGAAKIGLFAYNRETKEPVWNAGTAQARSTSKDVWIGGAGPFQRGTIYGAPQFAGSKLRVPLLPRKPEQIRRDLAEFHAEGEFPQPGAPADPDDPTDADHATVQHQAEAKPAEAPKLLPTEPAASKPAPATAPQQADVKPAEAPPPLPAEPPTPEPISPPSG
jgi:hypothetical protein